MSQPRRIFRVLHQRTTYTNDCIRTYHGPCRDYRNLSYGVRPTENVIRTRARDRPLLNIKRNRRLLTRSRSPPLAFFSNHYYAAKYGPLNRRNYLRSVVDSWARQIAQQRVFPVISRTRQCVENRNHRSPIIMVVSNILCYFRKLLLYYTALLRRIPVSGRRNRIIA